MFDGDNDGYSGMLPWVCIFGGLRRKIESVRDVGDEWEEDEEKY
jgi:hypothetical protein